MYKFMIKPYERAAVVVVRMIVEANVSAFVCTAGTMLMCSVCSRRLIFRMCQNIYVSSTHACAK